MKLYERFSAAPISTNNNYYSWQCGKLKKYDICHIPFRYVSHNFFWKKSPEKAFVLHKRHFGMIQVLFMLLLLPNNDLSGISKKISKPH